MPHRDYPHCLKCHIPLEWALIRRIETEVWYIEFALCAECNVEMLAMISPSVTMSIDGDCLKALLAAGADQLMKASVVKE